jgi:hypothetical protein
MTTGITDVDWLDDKVIDLSARIEKLEAENLGLRSALKIAIDAINGEGGVTVRTLFKARERIAELEAALRLIQGQAGMPDAGDGCRAIIKTAADALRTL